MNRSIRERLRDTLLIDRLSKGIGKLREAFQYYAEVKIYETGVTVATPKEWIKIKEIRQVWDKQQYKLWPGAKGQKELHKTRYYKYMNFMKENYGDLDDNLANGIVESQTMETMMKNIDQMIKTAKEIIEDPKINEKLNESKAESFKISLKVSDLYEPGQNLSDKVHLEITEVDEKEKNKKKKKNKKRKNQSISDDIRSAEITQTQSVGLDEITVTQSISDDIRSGDITETQSTGSDEITEIQSTGKESYEIPMINEMSVRCQSNEKLNSIEEGDEGEEDNGDRKSVV